MSNMIIKVEFLAGTKLESAVEEAKEKAVKLDVCYIEFDLDGTSFCIGRNADVCDVLEQYKAGMNHIVSY